MENRLIDLSEEILEEVRLNKKYQDQNTEHISNFRIRLADLEKIFAKLLKRLKLKI